MVERFNSTLKRLLRKLTQNDKVEWDKCLPFVLWAYRGTVHATTGFSPYRLLFGREIRMPLDELVKFWKGKEVQSEVDITDRIYRSYESKYGGCQRHCPAKRRERKESSETLS